jgi:hypothetical protein
MAVLDPSPWRTLGLIPLPLLLLSSLLQRKQASQSAPIVRPAPSPGQDIFLSIIPIAQRLSAAVARRDCCAAEAYLAL